MSDIAIVPERCSICEAEFGEDFVTMDFLHHRILARLEIEEENGEKEKVAVTITDSQGSESACCGVCLLKLMSKLRRAIKKEYKARASKEAADKPPATGAPPTSPNGC